MLKSRPEASRTAVEHSGSIIYSFLQIRSSLHLSTYLATIHSSVRTPRSTPLPELRTDNGAGLGEILLNSRQEEPRTAVEHSGFIIYSFLQVRRTKLTLINLTNNNTFKRPDSPCHASSLAENGQRGRFGRDFARISPRGTIDGRRTFMLHYLLFPAGQTDKLDINQPSGRPGPRPLLSCERTTGQVWATFC